MTEKRYYLGNGELHSICDRNKGGSDFFNMLTHFEVVDLLNELYEENQRGGDPRMEYDEIEKVMKSFMEGYDETESLIDNAFARGYDKGFRQGIDITLRMIKNLYKREGKLNDV